MVIYKYLILQSIMVNRGPIVSFHTCRFVHPPYCTSNICDYTGHVYIEILKLCACVHILNIAFSDC